MEIFKYNKTNTKWYKKIDWIRLLLGFIISFFIFFMFFYFISNSNNTDEIFFTSLIISFLIVIFFFFDDLIENRDRVFIQDGKTFGYIEIHKELSGKFLRTSEFYNILNKEDIEEVFEKNYLFEGIDKGEIESIESIRKKANCIVIKAKVKEKKWKSTSRFFISKVYVVEDLYKKKMIIPNDYDNYNIIYKNLKKRNDENV